MSQVQTEQQREQEQIIGVLTSVVVKGADKWQAVVAPDGSQYTKNLWTKDQQLVATLMSQIGNRLAFLCNVSHWTNQQQQPIRSLWIEAVGSPAVGAPAQPQVQPMAQPGGMTTIVQPQVIPMGVAPTPPQMATQAAPQPDLREQKIHRQTASKVAAIMLGYLTPEERNMSNLLTLSERLVSYYDHGMPRTLESELREQAPHLFQDVQPETGTDNAAPGAPAEYQGDDDIPF